MEIPTPTATYSLSTPPKTKEKTLETRTFIGLLEPMWAKRRFVCVGLDPDLNKIPRSVPARSDAQRVYRYMCGIVDATADIAAVFKPQEAAYAQLGREGDEVLRAVVAHINAVAPETAVIVDAKRMDIGATNEWYTEHLFGYLRADAVTVNPYLGLGAAAEVFTRHADKGIIVLCRTSNEGAYELQNLPVRLSVEQRSCWKEQHGELDDSTVPLYEVVAHNVTHHWNEHGNCALVAGATAPKELGEIRQIAGDTPLLIPGVGKQGGSLEEAVRNGADSKGGGMMINNSSGIDYAYEKDPDCDPSNFAAAARKAAFAMHEQGRAAQAA